MKLAPLIINVVLLLAHLVMIAFVSTRNTFEAGGQKILLFYHNYTAYFILFIVLNTLALFFIKTTKRVKATTFLIGFLALLIFIGFYSKFNPY